MKHRLVLAAVAAGVMCVVLFLVTPRVRSESEILSTETSATIQSSMVNIARENVELKERVAALESAVRFLHEKRRGEVLPHSQRREPAASFALNGGEPSAPNGPSSSGHIVPDRVHNRVRVEDGGLSQAERSKSGGDDDQRRGPEHSEALPMNAKESDDSTTNDVPPPPGDAKGTQRQQQSLSASPAVSGRRASNGSTTRAAVDPALRHVHFLAFAPLAPRQWRRILSFLQNGFEFAFVWMADMKFMNRYEHANVQQMSIQEHLLGPIEGEEKGKYKIRRRLLQLRILSLFGGWYMPLGVRCLQRFSVWERVAASVPFVMTYEYRSVIPSLDALYFKDRSLAAKLHSRLRHHVRPAAYDAAFESFVLDEHDGERVLLPRQFLLNHPDHQHFWNPGRPPSFALTGRAWRNVVQVAAGQQKPVLSVNFGEDGDAAVDDDANNDRERRESTHRPLLRLPTTLHENATTANFLWFDGELPMWAMCGVKTFAARGFRTIVWTYNADMRLPEGILRGDASIFYPKEFRMTLTQKGKRGSMASFSNMFRFKMLAATGGWWFDIDIICLRDAKEFAALADGHPVLLGFQDSLTMNGAVVYVNNPTIPLLCERKANEILKRNNRNIPWGAIGPQLWTAIMEENELVHHARPEWMFYSIPVYQLQRLFAASKVHKAHEQSKRSYAVHLWNEMKHGDYPNEHGSYLEEVVKDICPEVLTASVAEKGEKSTPPANAADASDEAVARAQQEGAVQTVAEVKKPPPKVDPDDVGW